MKLPVLAALMLAAAPLAAAPAPAPQHLTIVMTDHGFVPHLVNLRHGQPYVIRFVNRSGRGHDFEAPAFFHAARLDDASLGVVHDNKVDLDPGQSATLRMIVPDRPAASRSRAPTCPTPRADSAAIW